MKFIRKAVIKNTLELLIQEAEEKMNGGRISLSFKDIGNKIGDFNIKSKRPGWSASLIKVPVMIAVYNAIAKSRLSLEDELKINHYFTLEPFDPTSMMKDGTLITVKELLDYMIIASDNEATNILVNHIGLGYINKVMRKLRTKNTRMSHLLAYNVPRRCSKLNPDGSNLTTANDMATLLKSIYLGRAGTPQHCKLMIKTLERAPSSFYFPRNTKTKNGHKKTRIGGKIGIISDPEAGDDSHCAGVVNRDYALAIMINRIDSRKPDVLSHSLSTFDDFGIIVNYYLSLYSDSLFPNSTMPFNFQRIINPTSVIRSLSKTIFNFYYKI